MLQQLAEAINDLFNVESEVLRLDEVLHEGDDLLRKLNEVEPHKALLILHPFDDGIDQVGVLEDLFTELSGLIAVKVALEQDNFEESEHVDLHGVFLVVNDLAESFEDGVDDQVGDFVGLLLVELQRLQDQLHELTRGSVHRLRLLAQLVIHRLHSLSHDELEGDLDYSEEVLALAAEVLFFWLHVVEQVVEGLLDVLRHIPVHHILDHFIFRVEDDVSELAEVFDDDLGFIVLEEEQLPGQRHEHLGVLEELLQERVQNPPIMQFAIRKPPSARQSESGVVVFEDVEHVVEGDVPPQVSVLLVEWFVLGVVSGRQLPKNRELLDRPQLHLPVLRVQLIRHHLRKYLRQQTIKLFEETDDLLMVFFLVQERPEGLDDVHAVRVLGRLEGHVDRLPLIDLDIRIIPHNNVLEVLDGVEVGGDFLLGGS
mmetsp:Transcript_39177/g.37560  ORF Transcript_39177/g.37560 Transcript_39177/m.37560 type:complete len:427 (+) Transcript_39177:2658-3938(+)